ncbi:MAG: DeoR/GlpR family DNA-binding transcription regulator [Actinobacteria bacterium]|nr:DeoR/GlpR family DNA-binding transcription regulator [Actinomycetota bacterium]
MRASRDQRILQEVLSVGGLSVDELARRLDVSSATVRRDLAALEKQGLLRRTRGGAAPVEPIHDDLFIHDYSFHEQMRMHTPEKRRIALAAADLVQEGDTIALTSGTSTALVARSLRHRKNIMVVTNTVNTALELSQREGISVLVTGGYLRGNWFSMVGPTALQTIRWINFDKVFVSLNGIDPVRGLSANNEDEAAVNRAMIDRSLTKIAVLDSSKFGKISKAVICPASLMDVLITDEGAGDAVVAPYREMGIRVVRV